MTEAFNPDRAAAQHAPSVAFVIPHMGRPELLQQTIESILAQSAFAQVEQIVVVTKNTEPLQLTSHAKLTLVYAADANTISAQRNIGVRLTHSDYVAFLDADIQLAPDWLAVCLNLIENNSAIKLVSAQQKAAAKAGRIERLRTALSNTSLDQAVAFLPGRNLLLKRSLHDEIGGFPEHLQTCEDYFYTEKVSQHGQLFYTSRTDYIHLGEDKSLKQTFQKEIWRSEYNLRSVSGRTVPLREWPSILLPFWFFIALLATLCSVLWPALLLPALIMFIAPVAAYSLRLYQQPSHTVSLAYIVVFYSIYFIARTIGTVSGLRFIVLR